MGVLRHGVDHLIRIGVVTHLGIAEAQLSEVEPRELILQQFREDKATRHRGIHIGIVAHGQRRRPVVTQRSIEIKHAAPAERCAGKDGVDGLLELVILGRGGRDGVAHVVEVRNGQSAHGATVRHLVVAFHQVGAQVGVHGEVAHGLVVEEHELVVQLVLLAGGLLVLGLLLRVDGVTLELLVGEEVQIGLVLELQAGQDMVDEAHVAIDAVTGIVLIVLVATPIGVVGVGRARIVPVTAVPSDLRAVDGTLVEGLELLHVQLAVAPLDEFLHHVVVVVTRLRTAASGGVEIGHVGHHLQLFIGAGGRGGDIEDVLTQRAVRHVTAKLRVGVRDTYGRAVRGLRDGDIVRERDPGLEEGLHVIVRSLPGGRLRVAHLPTDLPARQVGP